jgi:pyruvate, water dikinase
VAFTVRATPTLIIGLVWGVLVSSCSSPVSPGARGSVRIEAKGTSVTPPFHLTVAPEDGPVATLSCPSGGGAQSEVPLRCTKDGFDIERSLGEFALTVRSKGFAFLTTIVTAEGVDRTHLVLEPLAAADRTEDYATRLDGKDCLLDLEALALSVVTDAGNTHSVKFYIRGLDTEPEVYFQNTRKHPLHFDFAQQVLGVAGTADQFSAATLAGSDRTALAGALVSYPSFSGSARAATPLLDAPWTLNFFPADPLTPEQVRLAHRLVEERLACLRWSGARNRLVYLPASSTKESEVMADNHAFEQAGIGWMSHLDLFGDVPLQTLNPGLAFGILRRMTPEELAVSAVSFRDILLLTRLPNELPLVGGTISEELQTPLAHVNVAARSRGTPNLAYPKASADPQVTSLLGHVVRFEVKQGSYSLQRATLKEAEGFWNSRAPQPFVPRFDVTFAGIPSFEDIGFDDAVRVGAKAANLAELSRALGENAPREGLAIPFHYYDAFMTESRTSPELCDEAHGDCISSGRDRSRCQEARELCLPADGAGEGEGEGEGEGFFDFLSRLFETASFNETTSLRDAVLANLRYMIEHTPVNAEFGELLDKRVAEVFQAARVRLRSSTNSEDLETFSGAGLYNSYSAGGDAKAPSQVISKVFASVWNFRAYEERTYWNIDHSAVRMGCAINQAFTDELANGVLITENVANPAIYGMYVNVQLGDVSVTNPTQGALPEIFSILGDTDHEISRQRFSTLSPDTPILSESEIQSLYRAGALARRHFSRLYGKGEGQLILDIEFKLTQERTIVFKQARPYATTR